MTLLVGRGRKVSVAEIFYTLQGEGVNAGRPAIFLRLGGCNLWSGHQEHRASDSLRTRSKCPVWCDTDFRPQIITSLEGVSSMVEGVIVKERIDTGHMPMVVITGGEPLLQLDLDLTRAILDGLGGFGYLAIETNGTIAIPDDVEPLIQCVSLSPKTSRDRIKLRRATEVRVVVPVYNANKYRAELGAGFAKHWFVSPQDSGIPEERLEAERAAARFVMRNPFWRLSTQTHKALGLP